MPKEGVRNRTVFVRGRTSGFFRSHRFIGYTRDVKIILPQLLSRGIRMQYRLMALAT